MTAPKRDRVEYMREYRARKRTGAGSAAAAPTGFDLAAMDLAAIAAPPAGDPDAVTPTVRLAGHAGAGSGFGQPNPSRRKQHSRTAPVLRVPDEVAPRTVHGPGRKQDRAGQSSSSTAYHSRVPAWRTSTARASKREVVVEVHRLARYRRRCRRRLRHTRPARTLTPPPETSSHGVSNHPFACGWPSSSAHTCARGVVRTCARRVRTGAGRPHPQGHGPPATREAASSLASSGSPRTAT